MASDENNVFRRAVSRIQQSKRLDVSGAMKELQQKSHGQIELESAIRWTSFAIAAYTLSSGAADKGIRVSRFAEGETYIHEARDHSAQFDDPAKLLEYITKFTADHRSKAIKAINND